MYPLRCFSAEVFPPRAVFFCPRSRPTGARGRMQNVHHFCWCVFAWWLVGLFGGLFVFPIPVFHVRPSSYLSLSLRPINMQFKLRSGATHVIAGTFTPLPAAAARVLNSVSRGDFSPFRRGLAWNDTSTHATKAPSAVESCYHGVVFSFFFFFLNHHFHFPAFLVGGIYPQRSSGQTVFTGCRPFSPPGTVPSFFCRA